MGRPARYASRRRTPTPAAEEVPTNRAHHADRRARHDQWNGTVARAVRRRGPETGGCCGPRPPTSRATPGRRPEPAPRPPALRAPAGSPSRGPPPPPRSSVRGRGPERPAPSAAIPEELAPIESWTPLRLAARAAGRACSSRHTPARSSTIRCAYQVGECHRRSHTDRDVGTRECLRGSRSDQRDGVTAVLQIGDRVRQRRVDRPVCHRAQIVERRTQVAQILDVPATSRRRHRCGPRRSPPTPTGPGRGRPAPRSSHVEHRRSTMEPEAGASPRRVFRGPVRSWRIPRPARGVRRARPGWLGSATHRCTAPEDRAVRRRPGPGAAMPPDATPARRVGRPVRVPACRRRTPARCASPWGPPRPPPSPPRRGCASQRRSTSHPRPGPARFGRRAARPDRAGGDVAAVRHHVIRAVGVLGQRRFPARPRPLPRSRLGGMHQLNRRDRRPTRRAPA